ncbi:hypothetical protein PLESTF_001614100 [Pleodorina starrii]|nr:hypothetical protein PLESTF_001614100 [Pleodorina starrii]
MQTANNNHHHLDSELLARRRLRPGVPPPPLCKCAAAQKSRYTSVTKTPEVCFGDDPPTRLVRVVVRTGAKQSSRQKPYRPLSPCPPACLPKSPSPPLRSPMREPQQQQQQQQGHLRTPSGGHTRVVA